MSIERKIDFKERLEKIFKGSSIILQTSNCILDELEKLGPEFRGIFLRARRFFRLKCHDKPISAYDCIINQIEQNKERKFIVATQDETLRKSLRKIGGIPIIYIKNDSLQMEEPSIESKKIAANENKNKFVPQTHEMEKIEKINRELEIQRRIKEKKEIIKLRNQLGLLPKKIAKGPNPLSMKSKKIYKNEKQNNSNQNDDSKKDINQQKTLKKKNRTHKRKKTGENLKKIKID